MNVIREPLVTVILVLILMSAVQSNTIAVILVNVQILKVRVPPIDLLGTRLKMNQPILTAQSLFKLRLGRPADPL